MKKNNFLKKLLTLSLLITLNLFFSQCKKDDNELFVQENSTNTISSLSVIAPTDGYKLEDSFPSGYAKDGSVDYTSVIQAVIDKYPSVVFPNFPILINDSGLKVPSNRTITILEGSELRLKPTSKANYDMIVMRSASNVTLYNPVLVGDRYKHLGTGGEWGMGISINGGGNITIVNPKAREMWGDGIYIGVDNDIIPRNITIKNAVVEYNRRDGITIAAVDGLNLESPYAAFSNGTLPMAGIAFEPDNNKEEIKNVLISNPRTQENAGTGMFVDFGNLMGGGQKKVNVTITNHIDVGSLRGVKAMSRITDGISTIQGDLKFVNPSWSKNAETAIMTILFGVNDVHLIIENPIVKNLSNYQLTKEETLAYLIFKTRINRSAWYDITFASNWPNMNTATITEPLLAPIVAPITSTNDVVFAINAGGSAFRASNGITYEADKAFSGGSIYKTTNTISNTVDDVLYQSERYGNFSYAVPVVNGTYEVTFKLAETYHTAAGKRQFDILMENSNEAFNDVDIYKSAGMNAAFDLVKSVTVNDGVLNVNFRTDIDNAKISAFHVKSTSNVAPITVLPPTSSLIYAINAGGGVFQATNGITYQADKYFLGGNTYGNSSTISNTEDDNLYQNERNGNFSYALPVANGTYEITLRFAEIFHLASGSRQFDALVEGVEIVSNLDIFQNVGSKAAFDLVKTVSVTDGVLNLQLRTDINNANLSAFHVIKK